MLACSALEKTGLAEIAEAIEKFYLHLAPGLRQKRASQRLYWLEEALREALEEWFVGKVTPLELKKTRDAVEKGEILVSQAVEKLLKALK